MRYHYLTHEISNSAQCYGLFDGDKEVGFCAVTHFPSQAIKNLKHCHRLVIMPDYQGIGLGTKFLAEVAKIYSKQGFEFSIVTSARNLIFALKRRNKEWCLTRYGKSQPQMGLQKMNRTSSRNRETASFFWRKEANGK